MENQKKNEPKIDENLSSKIDETFVSDKEKAEKRNKNRLNEIIRFAIIGALCTIIDFGISFLFLEIFANNLSTISSWGFYLAFAISGTISFLISSVVNFVLSRIYVFKNVDKNINTNNQKSFWIFILLGVGGWLIGIGIQELDILICNMAWPTLNLDTNITKVSFSSLFKTGGIAFWVYVAIFCLKTAVSLVYNYVTRKLFIFKAPKE